MRGPERGRAYAAIGVLFASAMMATTVPTPLYSFWERSYGFGSIVTTLVFATYAVGVIATLLFAGRDSDVDGRRPVLLVCVGLSALSSILFLLADGLPLLFVARLISGFSAGLISPTATATLVDLAGKAPLWSRTVPGVVNLFGLGLGPILAGVLAESASHPTRLPFEVALGVVVVTAVLALGVAYRDRPMRRSPVMIVGRPALGLPGTGRGTFAAAALAGLTTFALLGLFSALVPTFLAKVIGQHHPWVIGASVSLLFGVTVVTQLSVRGLRARAAIQLGLAVMIVGLAVLAASLDAASYPLFVVGTVISGIAIGAAFSGGLATALSVASDSERGRVSSLFYLIAYAGVTVPVIGAGIGVAHAPILSTFIVVGSVLAAFDLAALAYLRRGTPGHKAPSTPPG
jgi:MFS family permease